MSETSSSLPKRNRLLDFSSCSIESMLSVPTKFIFLKTRSGQNSYLFSRSEVSTLLQISMLASELDVILSLVYESLDRSKKCKFYRETIESGNGSVYLRALLPLLSVHADTAENALNYVTSESFGLHEILNSLDACAVELKKFSEQNWNMAEQLAYMTPGRPNQLSNEKKTIAELQDTVSERIFYLKEISGSDDEDTNNIFSPMEEYCTLLLAKVDAPAEQYGEVHHTASQINAAQALALLGGKDSSISHEETNTTDHDT